MAESRPTAAEPHKGLSDPGAGRRHLRQTSSLMSVASWQRDVFAASWQPGAVPHGRLLPSSQGARPRDAPGWRDPQPQAQPDLRKIAPVLCNSASRSSRNSLEGRSSSLTHSVRLSTSYVGCSAFMLNSLAHHPRGCRSVVGGSAAPTCLCQRRGWPRPAPLDPSAPCADDERVSVLVLLHLVLVPSESAHQRFPCHPRLTSSAYASGCSRSRGIARQSSNANASNTLGGLAFLRRDVTRSSHGVEVAAGSEVFGSPAGH